MLLVDTAGRLAIDEALMREIKDLHAAMNPVETLFVVDAMQGQDAANTAKAFKDALPLTGIVLTKMYFLHRTFPLFLPITSINLALKSFWILFGPRKEKW